MMIATAPYSWKQIEIQVRSVVTRQAELFQEFNADSELIVNFNGLTGSVAIAAPTPFRIYAADISKSAFYRNCEIAYKYAYQVEYFCEEEILGTAEAISKLLCPAQKRNRYRFGSASLILNESALRKVLETFILRYRTFSTKPKKDFVLSINQLSLLANMKSRSVRTSLRRENMVPKLSEHAGANSHWESCDQLGVHEAKQWLARRRTFIPQLATSSAEPKKHCHHDSK
jgi:hypothetical protein